MKCEFCGQQDSPTHACDLAYVKERVTILKNLADATLKVMAIEFAWTFTLDDGVAVKVEFHGAPTAKHVRAFAKIFAAVSEHYVTNDTDENRGATNYLAASREYSMK